MTKRALAALMLLWAPAGLAQEAAPDAGATVYFGFDRAAFDAEGIAAIARTAREAIAAGSGAVIVSGYADTSGDALYNLDLGARRARSVAEDLIARGVPAAAVTTTTFGEAVLAEPTPDGVREDDNRRVVIVRSAPGAYEAPDPSQPIRFPLP